jgi:hypothetical protein
MGRGTKMSDALWYGFEKFAYIECNCGNQEKGMECEDWCEARKETESMPSTEHIKDPELRKQYEWD